MSQYAAGPGLTRAHIELRRARILDGVPRPLSAVGADAVPLPPRRARFLCREAEDLYWNELSWEELTDEEVVAGGHLTELVFPAFLSFIDGLLPGADGPDPPRPHPDVVEEILLFLGERSTEFTGRLERGADSERVVRARVMTDRLIDLVLCRLYRLTPEELDALEAAG